MGAPGRILMLGTSPASHGGIAAVVATYRAAGLFSRWPVQYIATHVDGSLADKAAHAARALGAFLMAAIAGRAVVHVLAASRWSFWRKSVFMALALLLRWPVIFHLHGGGFARFHGRSGPLARRAIRFFLDRVAVILVLSERWAAWMHPATSNPRIVCIPNPVRLPPPSSVARERSVVFFSGRCCEAKGVYDLLEAVAALRPSCPRLRVECAGDGDLGGLWRRAAVLGIGRQVSLRGWVGPRERDQLLARCTLFVLPSHVEGLPVSLLEAMAAGCPVVATAVGGVPDLVTDGVNGLLVEPKDPWALAQAIRKLLQDPQLAARLGHAARATVAARFTVEPTLERLEQIYAALGVRRGALRAGFASRRLQEMS